MDDIEKLINYLKSDDLFTRFNAVAQLAKIKDERAVEGLIYALTDESDVIRDIAFRGLLNLSIVIKSPKAVDFLIGVLKDPSEGNRLMAAMALGNTGDPRAVEPLIKLLKNNDPNLKGLRAYSAEALGKIKDNVAVSVLIQTLLRDPHPAARYRAAYALGEIGDKRTIRFLIKALADKEDRNIELFSIEALKKFGETAVDALIEVLENKKHGLRKEAATALGEIKDSRAVGLLIEALKDENFLVRDNAAFALGKIIKEQNSIERLDEIRRCLLEFAGKLDRDSPTYKHARQSVSNLFILLNARKNQLLASQLDIHLDKKTLRPRRDSNSRYRIRRALAA